MNLADLDGRATITVEQAAALLDVGRGTAYQAARDGSLPTITLGRRLLVPVPALLRLLGADPPNGDGPAGTGPSETSSSVGVGEGAQNGV